MVRKPLRCLERPRQHLVARKFTDLHLKPPAGGGNVKVVVRVRPFNSREKDRHAECIITMNGNQTIIAPPSNEHRPKGSKAAVDGPKTFAFDKSYWSFDRNDEHYAGQDNLFDDLGQPLLDNAFGGYNNCIFAYGQTGSGKSYSMMGYGQEYGVIPRICKEMFTRIEGLQSDKSTNCRVEVSYLEIYNERVRDLLNPSNKGNLKVREHPSTGPYVEDLAKLVVRSFPEIENLMDEGNKARTVAATNMNETSSRSHAVFTLTLTQKKHDADTNMDMERVAKISLVDLAGSERATSTGATGSRLKEGAEINRSLSTLGRVIAALADSSSGAKKKTVVPYRDSVLTWLLKDSLGGNSMTAMIAAISPADINFEETLSTLRYADSAKRIKQHAVVNEDANARMIRELKEELEKLRSQLGGTGGSDSMPGGFSEVQYPPDTPLDKQMVTITGPDGAAKQVSKAEIAEQLSQSEKLYQDLNQTWEQKLQRTEEIHKEREAALEELGISIEKGFVGMSTPKKMPHLVNLSDDPLLAECLVYNLKPGKTTVGNDEMANTTAEIRLKGSKILEEHCVFENENNIVSVIPKVDAPVMVNGMRVDKPTRLKSGFRVILGDFHIFRFNHPEEARAERAEEGSKLRQSMTVDDLDDPDMAHPPDGDRPDSPSPYRTHESEYDWSFARREAARAILGPGENLANKTDEELNALFEDLQRERANRRGPGDGRRDEDSDSTTSYPVREKYMSAATLDGYSVDTSITAPSTPPPGDESGKGGQDLHSQLDGQLSDGMSTPRSDAAREVEARRHADEVAELRRQLKEQKEQHERALEQIKPSPSKRVQIEEMDPRSKSLARQALQKWRQRKYVRMAGQMLQYASLLKEAQILSQSLGKAVYFQFAVIDAAQNLYSTYDMVLNDVSDENDDDELLTCPKPCIGVRIANFKHIVVYVWSLAKLQRRLAQMRQMHQYLDRPQYVQHFRLDNPFFDSSMPSFSRIGEAQVALSAVFESRVQDFTVDVVSPFTFSPVGILKLSLEPSMAEAPPHTLKFNVVLHDLAGFAEMEGTEVHAQLSVPRVSEDQGVTTTQIVSGFDEGPIRFDSLHGMSIPATSSRDARLRITVFARVSHMHLEKLKSWDDIRDSTFGRTSISQTSRIAESEFHTEEKHDVFVRAQIQELGESGEYEPVDVIQHDTLDSGAFQLHQGIQRRIALDITHTCGETLPWTEVTGFRTSGVHLSDSGGHVPEGAGPQHEIPLKIVSRPTFVDNADGTSNINVVGVWDSSAHSSPLLDRATADRHRIRFTLLWEVFSSRMTNPLKFKLDLSCQIRPRAWLYTPNILTQYFNNQRTAKSTTGIFRVGIKPSPIESVTDLWRMDTQYDYVKGEENLDAWSPRGVSLIRDFIKEQRQQYKAADIETTRSVFGNGALKVDSGSATPVGQPLSEEQKALVSKFLLVWQNRAPDPSATILSNENIAPPAKGAAFASKPQASEKSSNPTLSANVEYFPKNPLLLKSGHLLAPDATQTRWVRRYYELRLPFLHVFDPETGNELNAINLSNSKVDHQPQVARLLQRPSNSRLNIFAIYAKENAYLFATKSESEKLQWIMKIDESYFGGNGTPR